MCCPQASIASATTACSPSTTRAGTSREHANCSRCQTPIDAIKAATTDANHTTSLPLLHDHREVRTRLRFYDNRRQPLLDDNDADTIDTVRVTCCNAATAWLLLARMTSGASATNLGAYAAHAVDIAHGPSG